jgi:4-carboxymuconolactone decarboxylase
MFASKQAVAPTRPGTALTVTREDRGMNDEQDRQRGQQAWRDVMGADGPPITDPFMEFTSDHVFGRLWTRPGLTTRDRRLITLTAIAAAGAEAALALHLRAAYESGDLDLDELDELVVHLAHYVGWPAATPVYMALGTLRAEVGSESP